MNSKTVVLAGVVFALLVAGMFGFAYLKKQESVATSNADDVTQDSTLVPEDRRYDYIKSVDAKVYYLDGVATVVGEILMPTPCDLLTYESSVMESFPEQVQLDFTVINNAESCVQVVTPARFRFDFTVSSEARYHAHFEGRDIRLNLFPAETGEAPEDFEIFIKG